MRCIIFWFNTGRNSRYVTSDKKPIIAMLQPRVTLQMITQGPAIVMMEPKIPTHLCAVFCGARKLNILR